jgi:hypothetical protein
VTDEIRGADYALTEDDERIAIMAHSGAHYELDNQNLYDEFKPLMVNGPGWSFIKKFDKVKDGKSTVMVLKTQAKGTSTELNRKQAAYAAKLASTSSRALQRF